MLRLNFLKDTKKVSFPAEVPGLELLAGCRGSAFLPSGVSRFGLACGRQGLRVLKPSLNHSLPSAFVGVV
ncbi:MAG: hypothetical protein UZ12_BCD005002158 [Bacteroidetes bacterium OLB12]|nr:MAG: hypothetical protein UZ12_BCD005002158 [Bacteroidetes bacterium OLB12]